MADTIIAANTGAASGSCPAGTNGPDEIIFNSNLNNNTILLTSNLPTVTDDLIVTGPSGNNQITISGDNTYSIFIVEGVRFHLFKVTLTGGYGTAPESIFPWGYGRGSAVAAFSGTQVTIDKCTFSNNTGFAGGAIYTEDSSTINLLSNTITNNSAFSGRGVAIYNNSNLNVINSTLSNNFANSSAGAIKGYERVSIKVKKQLNTQ